MFDETQLCFVKDPNDLITEVDFVFIKHISADYVRYDASDYSVAQRCWDENTDSLDIIAYCEFGHLRRFRSRCARMLKETDPGGNRRNVPHRKVLGPAYAPACRGISAEKVIGRALYAKACEFDLEGILLKESYRRFEEGKTLGRPRVIVDRENVRELHGQGNSVRIIAAQLGLTKSTVHSIVVA